MIIQRYSWCLLLSFLTLSRSQVSLIEAGPGVLDAIGTLECHKRMYTYRVVQADENGRQCWDTLSVWACWGRCDSNEISDWRFPYKKSSHPVCVHYGRNRAIATLRHCEDGALPTAKIYEYMEAATCRCQQCSSSDTSCEGLRYRPHRSHPDLLGFPSDQAAWSFVCSLSGLLRELGGPLASLAQPVMSVAQYCSMMETETVEAQVYCVVDGVDSMRNLMTKLRGVPYADENAFRGYCESWAVSSGPLASPAQLVTSVVQYCSMMETETLEAQVYCVVDGVDSMRNVTFKSAKTCSCFHCKKD